jgi:dTDP-4-amino-4,6-dideoxygalactose transaminase
MGRQTMPAGAKKHRLGDLAVLGGPPAFPEALHVGRPNIGDRARFLERVDDILSSRWLTNHARYVQELERRVAAYVGVKHCIATCNGTVALEIAMRALDLRGEVIVPALTFVATAHALQWQQITPVFCDVDPDTLNLDPSRVEQAITPRTTGIVGVHLWGRPCDVDRLAGIARRRSLKLLFDGAHAFGCTSGGRMIGRFGDAEVFSFHATKVLNSFEGGAIVTDDDDLAAAVRLMTNFGFADYDTVVSIGINGKMSEVAAAMGLTGLDSFPEFVEVNYRNYRQYDAELGAVPGVRLLPYDRGERCTFQYVVVDVDETVSHLTRDQLLKVLWSENVLARRYFYPGCHRMEPYRSLYPDAGERLPVTEAALQRVLALPTGTAVDVEDVSTVCRLIRFAVENGPDLRRELEASPPALAPAGRAGPGG